MIKRVWNDKVKESFYDICCRLNDWMNDEFMQDEQTKLSISDIMDWIPEAVDIDGLIDDFRYHTKIEISFNSETYDKGCDIWILAFAQDGKRKLIDSFLLEMPIDNNLTIGTKECDEFWQLLKEYKDENTIEIEY